MVRIDRGISPYLLSEVSISSTERACPKHVQTDRCKLCDRLPPANYTVSIHHRNPGNKRYVGGPVDSALSGQKGTGTMDKSTSDPGCGTVEKHDEITIARDALFLIKSIPTAFDEKRSDA